MKNNTFALLGILFGFVLVVAGVWAIALYIRSIFAVYQLFILLPEYGFPIWGEMFGIIFSLVWIWYGSKMFFWGRRKLKGQR